MSLDDDHAAIIKLARPTRIFASEFSSRMKKTYSDCFQELPEEGPAVERHPDSPEELRRLPQAEELAVVEAVH